jgi:hypothetical protein
MSGPCLVLLGLSSSVFSVDWLRFEIRRVGMVGLESGESMFSLWAA